MNFEVNFFEKIEYRFYYSTQKIGKYELSKKTIEITINENYDEHIDKCTYKWQNAINIYPKPTPIKITAALRIIICFGFRRNPIMS